MTNRSRAESERQPRPLSLRVKTLLIIMVTLVGLLGMLHMALSTYVLGSFVRLEEKTVSTDAARARDALLSNLAALDRTTQDYAHWDDTYQFVQDINQDYIDENTIPSVFTDNRLSLMEFVSVAGTAIFSKSFDLTTEQEIPVPEKFRHLAANLPPLLGHPISSTTGIVLLPEAPMLVASEAILTNEGEGPVAGVLIMGLALDGYELARLTETTHLAITVIRLDRPDADLAPEILEAKDAFKNNPNSDTFVQPLRGEKSIAGYTMFTDVMGQPAFLLQVTEGREIYAQGVASLRYLSIATVLAGLLQGGVVLLLLERFVLSRLTRLTTVARKIVDGDLEARAPVESGDETGVLAETFNAMTARLEQMLHGERERNEQLQATVQRYVEHMATVAQGDLATRLAPVQDRGEVLVPLAILGRHLDETVGNLQDMALQIRETASNLGSSSAEILTTTSQQTAGANQQSAAIAQASATIGQVSIIAKQTTERAWGVARLAQRSADLSRAGQQAVAETVEGMEQVKKKVEGISHDILALSEQTKAIGQIIATVNAIATQSNLLALNAAVEAARAGEAGKGFAVVAGEVRTMAERSRTATVQVKEILSEIQRSVGTVVVATEAGLKGTDAGIRMVGSAGGIIQQLAESVTESAQAAEQIAAAADQQLAGMEQISQAVLNIYQVTQQAVGSAHQSERSAAELNTLAEQLRQLVSRYRL